MKKVILSVMLLASLSLNAANEKIVKSSVKNVTIFTQAAQVFRTSSVSLNPGTTNLVFTDISPFINPSSIQAGTKGNVTILGVVHNIKYPEPLKADDGTLPKQVLKEIALVEDSISELNFVKEELFDRRNALQLEKDMILKNKLAQGEGKSDSLPVLKQAMEFFRIKLNDINSQLSKIKRNEKQNQQANVRLSARLNDLKTYKNNEGPPKKYEPVHEVIVTVNADEIATVSIDVNYMVSKAGWTPFYDLRSNSPSAPVQLNYKANVFQNSGESWNNVKLKLSTSNPNKSNIKPNLPPWYVNYYTASQREVQILSGARSKSLDNTTSSNEYLVKADLNSKTPAEIADDYSQLIQTMTNVEFDIKSLFTIPSDGANHIVSVKTSELPANYYHYLVPKVESEAFLIAKITGWEDLNLLPGRANVFYEGTYVGETVLNPSIINDTLELALGRDNGITVTRTKLPVKEENKLLGNDITKTVSYELRMKNSKLKPVFLIIEDQIPMTLNKEIKIEMKDNSKADYNDKTGLLKWNATVGSKEYKTFTFSYAVTYNKDKPLSMH